jgi:hypothetical protein
LQRIGPGMDISVDLGEGSQIDEHIIALLQSK